MTLGMKMKREFVSKAGSSPLSKNSHLDDLPANRRSGIFGEHIRPSKGFGRSY